MVEHSNNDDTQPPGVDPPLIGSSSQPHDDSPTDNQKDPTMEITTEKDKITPIH